MEHTLMVTAMVATFALASACAPAALAALYADSPDTVSFAPDSMVSRGITAIRADLAKMVATPGMKLKLTEIHHVVLTDSMLSSGLWTMTAPARTECR